MAFKRLDPEDFIVSVSIVSQPVWTGGSNDLITYFTSSQQRLDKSGKYYLSVFNGPIGELSTETQFDIAFANKDGKGSTAYNAGVSLERTYSQTIYGQYRSLLLEDEDAVFKFGGVEQDSFYVLNISRARYKEKIITWYFKISIKWKWGFKPKLNFN